MSKIILLTFIDCYEDVKNILPNNINISTESTKTEIANAVISCYEELAKTLYVYGHQHFMTRRSIGDGESFYLHK